MLKNGGHKNKKFNSLALMNDATLFKCCVIKSCILKINIMHDQ